MVAQPPILKRIDFGLMNGNDKESMDGYLHHIRHAKYILCWDAPKFIFHELKLNTTSNLTSLTLWRRNTSFHLLLLSITEFLNQNQTLKSLCISDFLSPFATTSHSIWVDFCHIACHHKSLINLNLSGNKLHECVCVNGQASIRLCEILFQELSSSESKIQALNVSSNHLGAYTDDIVTSINNMLSSNTSLRILNLSSNPWLKIEQISRAISLNRYITTLDIGYTGLAHSTMNGLYNALKINTSLVELNLSRNIFTVKEQIVPSLLNALMSNHTLEILGLSYVHLSEEAMISLAQCMKTHRSLKFINLLHNELQPHELCSLASSLHENHDLGICVTFFLPPRQKQQFVSSMRAFQKHPNLTATIGENVFDVGLRFKVQERAFLERLHRIEFWNFNG